MNSRIKLVIMLNLLLYQHQVQANLRIIYDRMEPLNVSKESKLQNLSFHIAPYNISYFQGEFQVVQDVISSKLKMNIEVIRCFVGEAPDTCEYLINLKTPNFCMFVNGENTAWNTITDAFTPKLRCPFRKGRYVSNRATFAADKWTIFPLDKWYFKSVFKVYEGDVLILPIIIECHFIRVH